MCVIQDCNRFLLMTTGCGGLIQDDNYRMSLINIYIYTLLQFYPYKEHI